MAQVYSTVLDGKTLGQHVKGGRGRPGWCKILARPAMWKMLVGVLVVMLISPIFITHILPGLVSRQRAYSWFRNREGQRRLRDCA